MRKGKWQVPLIDGDEQDYLTGWHHYCHKKPGLRPSIKRQYQRRARKHARHVLSDEVRQTYAKEPISEEN